MLNSLGSGEQFDLASILESEGCLEEEVEVGLKLELQSSAGEELKAPEIDFEIPDDHY